MGSSGAILGKYLPPFSQLSEIMAHHFIQRANANENSLQNNYIAFYFQGAPSRWCFDQFIKVRPQESIVSNDYVATQLTGENGILNRAEYTLVDYNGILVPPIWNTKVSSSNGSMRPLNDLLPHLISFRGYGSGIDGHQSNSARQSNPVPSAGSITGHLADQSTALFRVLQFPPLNSWSGYQSLNGTGATLVFNQGKINYASQLLQPFVSRGETSFLDNVRRKYLSLISEVHKNLHNFKSRSTAGLENLKRDFEKGSKMIDEGVEDLNSSWFQLYSKYESIILSTLKERGVPGFSDQPIIVQNHPHFRLKANSKISIPNSGSDLRDLLINAKCESLISSFALCEFAVTRGYGNCFEFGDLNLTHLQGYLDEGNEMQTFSLEFDQHETGVIPATYLNAMYFRAFGAGLLELIDRLKENGIFEKTFIHLVQEFGRSPKLDGSGSDHAFNGMISSVFTGINKNGPMIVGNILKESDKGSALYGGTYGSMAPTTVNGESVNLNPAHIASTMATLMQWPQNPWINVATPLIIRTSDSLNSIASGDII